MLSTIKALRRILKESRHAELINEENAYFNGRHSMADIILINANIFSYEAAILDSVISDCENVIKDSYKWSFITEGISENRVGKLSVCYEILAIAREERLNYK